MLKPVTESSPFRESFEAKNLCENLFFLERNVHLKRFGYSQLKPRFYSL